MRLDRDRRRDTRCGSASRRSRSRTGRPRRPYGPAVAPRRAGPGRTRRRCSCPLRSPPRRRRTSRRRGGGRRSASAYADRAASNISSLYETPGVVGEKPDQPTPTTPTRGSIPTVIPCRGCTTCVWTPSPEYVERANVTRFMRAHGIGDVRGARRPIGRRHRLVLGRSGAATWTSRSSTPYDRVLDTSRGVSGPRGSSAATTNVAHQCVDVWAERTPEAVAVVWEAEDGDVRRVTYRGAPRADGPARRTGCARSASASATRSASSCRWRSRPWPR